MSRGNINAIEGRTKTTTQGGFDRALVELLPSSSQMCLAVIAISIQLSSFVVFISAGLFIYQHIESWVFALLFGMMIAGLNWIFNAVVLNGAIPPWLTSREVEDYDNKKGYKLSTVLITFFWSIMNAFYFALSIISLFFEKQVKQFISAEFIKLQMMGGSSESAQSMFELGLDKPSLLHLVDFATSSHGFWTFLLLLVGINVLISLPMILKFIFSEAVWSYRKLQYDDARNRIIAGHEQHKMMLKKTLERYNLEPESYTSAWEDPPFNTKTSKLEDPELITDKEMFALFDEGEAEAKSPTTDQKGISVSDEDEVDHVDRNQVLDDQPAMGDHVGLD